MNVRSDIMRRMVLWAMREDRVRIVGPVCVECVYDRAVLPKGVSHLRLTREK